MKKYPEDIIWNTITASARTKFDYTAFKKEFGAFDNNRVLDTVLYQVLEGFAENKSTSEVAENLSHDLQMLSYPFAEKNFEPFIASHETIFASEIKATARALALFADHKEIPEILSEIDLFLLN